MGLDEEFLADAIAFSDPAGVISCYASHTPNGATSSAPAAHVEMRNGLREVIDHARSSDPAGAGVLARRIAAIEPDLDWLTSPRTKGRGRALFVGVESGLVMSVTLQLPFHTRAIHDGNAYVRPLFAACDEGRESGLVDVAKDTVRLWRWTAGEVSLLSRREFEVLDEQVARQGRAPAPSNG